MGIGDILLYYNNPLPLIQLTSLKLTRPARAVQQFITVQYHSWPLIQYRLTDQMSSIQILNIFQPASPGSPNRCVLSLTIWYGTVHPKRREISLVCTCMYVCVQTLKQLKLLQHCTTQRVWIRSCYSTRTFFGEYIPGAVADPQEHAKGKVINAALKLDFTSRK